MNNMRISNLNNIYLELCIRDKNFLHIAAGIVWDKYRGFWCN